MDIAHVQSSDGLAYYSLREKASVRRWNSETVLFRSREMDGRLKSQAHG
jgi:hypothetical protein